MFCFKCGTEIPEGAGFCHKCGSKVIEAGKLQQVSVSAEREDNGKQQTSTVLAGQIKQRVEPMKQTGKKKSGKWPLILVIMLCVTIVVVVFVVDHAYFNREVVSTMNFNEENNLNSVESMDGHTMLEQADVPFQENGSAADGHIESIYYIGDTASMSQSHSPDGTVYYDITMTEWGTYYDSIYDNTYVYIAFEVVNTGKEVISLSEYSFKAYVNDYEVDIGCLAEDSLSATLSPGRRATGKVHIQMEPENINQLELELGDIIFCIQDNSFMEEVPFGYEGEEDYTDYIEWGGIYDDGWYDTTLTFSLYSDGSQDPECGYMTELFRGMESTGKLYYLGGNLFRWESEGFDSVRPETYYVYAVYNNQEYQLELYNSNDEYEVTFTLYEQYIP